MTTEGERDVGGPAVDEGSFDDFYRSHYGPVVRLAYTLTGRRDLAEELAQDGFLAANRTWSKVSAYDDPGAWVRRVVANRCVSSGRRHLTGLRLVARLARERPPEPDLTTESDELWQAVRSLPRRQAQVIALTYLEDRSVADVAAVLGCGPETVRTHLRRGRTELARRLTDARTVDAADQDERTR